MSYSLADTPTPVKVYEQNFVLLHDQDVRLAQVSRYEALAVKCLHGVAKRSGGRG